MLENEKGITLIALIITIIVMLILVGVTINVALNGGLFTKASEAAMETEKRLILEQIISLAEWDNNGKINVKATVDNVKEEFGEDKVSTTPNPVASGATSAIVTITGKHGVYNYKITTSEISITGENGSGPAPGDDPQALSELERYFFNEDGTGKTVPMSIDDNDDLGPIITFANDETIPEAEEDIQFMKNVIVSLQEGIATAFIEYKGADYKFEFQMLGENDYQTILGSDNEKITRVPTIYSGDTDEEKIKQYFIGYSGEGKSIANLIDLEKTFEQGANPTNVIFKDNDIINASTELIVPTIAFGNGEPLEVTYNQKKYIIEYELDQNFGMVISTTAIREDKIVEEKWGNPENDRYYITSELGDMAITITDTNKVMLGIGNRDAFLPIGYGYVKDEITVSVAGEERTIYNAILSTVIVQKYVIIGAIEDGRINLYEAKGLDYTNSKNEVIRYEYINITDKTTVLAESPMNKYNFKESYLGSKYSGTTNAFGLEYEEDRTNGVMYTYLDATTECNRKFGPETIYNYKLITNFTPTYGEGIPEDIKTTLRNSQVILAQKLSSLEGDPDGAYYEVFGYIDTEGIHLVDAKVGARDEDGYPTEVTSITDLEQVYAKQ